MTEKQNRFIPLISIDQIQTYVEYIEIYESQFVKDLYESGLPQAIKSSQGHISREVMLRLFDKLEKELSNESLNRMIAHSCRLNVDKILVGKHLEGSVINALHSLFEQLKVDSTDTEFMIDDYGDHYWVYRKRAHDMQIGCVVTLIIFTYLIQKLTQSQWTPSIVSTTLTNGQPLSSFFPTHNIDYKHRSVYTGVYVPKSLVEKTITPFIGEEQQHRIKELHTFKYSLKALLKPYLSISMPTINEAAEYANMSVRTLQRRLKQENETYSEILEEVMDEIACESLIGSDETITNIAFNLGYSNTSHFTRAFKKKFELTPSAFRERYQK